MDDINNIIASIKKDQTLNSTIDVERLLELNESIEYDYLEGETLAKISTDIFEAVKQQVSPDIVQEICKKLIGFIYVYEIKKLHKGRHIRWIRNSSENNKKPLTNGGIVVDIKNLDGGTQILCKNKNRFIQYKFDECITFQKLSVDEQLILSCNEHI
jgi:hypothetical protein